MLNLLVRNGYLNYDRIHLHSKSLGREKYQFLRDFFEALEQTAGKEVASFHTSSDDIVPVENEDTKERSIMAFDDVMQEKQTPIEKYFCQGRHGNADCFCLTQDYYRIPKQGIRSNANTLILFSQDTKNMRAMHDSFVSGDMDFNEFREFRKKCRAEPYGFAVIDLTSKAYDGKYRCGFDRFYIPKSLI